MSLTKEQRVRREKAKLRRLLKAIDKDRLKAAEKLIDNVAFMAVCLEDLAAHMMEHGMVSEYQNGENQWGTKKSPEAEYYSQLMQRYLPAMKQLTDLLPDGPPAGAQPSDPMMDWVNRGRSS